MLRLKLCLFLVFLGLVGCGTGSSGSINSDIPPDPNVAPPPTASGSLIPTVTLDDKDASNPGRISLIIGGVSYQETDSETTEFKVVEYTQDNLTVVEDGVVQGKLLTEDSGLSLDVAFIIDNTGSMAEEIAGVRSSVLQFIDTLRAGGQDVQAGIVAFNDGLPNSFDNNVDPEDLRAKPAIYGFRNLEDDFSESGNLYSFIASLRATDPGRNFDLPELAFAGLDFARRTFTWRDNAQRVYILVTDDSAWGRGYPGTANDKGIDEDYFTDETLAKLLRDEGSVVHAYSPAPKSENFLSAGEYNVKPLTDITGGIWNELNRSGEFDLLELGITDVTLASTKVEFVKNGDPNEIMKRKVRVVVRVEDNGKVYDGERIVEIDY